MDVLSGQSGTYLERRFSLHLIPLSIISLPTKNP